MYFVIGQLFFVLFCFIFFFLALQHKLKHNREIMVTHDIALFFSKLMARAFHCCHMLKHNMDKILDPNNGRR